MQKKDEDKAKISPYIVYLFVFIVVGSAILQIISTATGRKLVD
jgi:hypothetical protein